MGIISWIKRKTLSLNLCLPRPKSIFNPPLAEIAHAWKPGIFWKILRKLEKWDYNIRIITDSDGHFGIGQFLTCYSQIMKSTSAWEFFQIFSKSLSKFSKFIKKFYRNIRKFSENILKFSIKNESKQNFLSYTILYSRYPVSTKEKKRSFGTECKVVRKKREAKLTSEF